MDDIEMGIVQTEFAELIWKHEPVTSGELVKMCEKEFNWKKSTTYTVLKKLCEKGIFKNEGGMVSSLMSRDEFNSARSERFVNETFSGSLPAFIAAFIGNKALSAEEAEEIQKMIDKYKS